MKADFIKRRSLYPLEESSYEYLLDLAQDADLGRSVNTALEKLEESFEPLSGVLPKEYTILEMDVLADLLRIFADYNREKDRVTIEETLRLQSELNAKLDSEQKAAVAEGLKDDEQYLFELLQRDDLNKTERERTKQGSRYLLQKLEEVNAPMRE